MTEQRLKKLSIILGTVLLAEIALLAVPLSMNILGEMIEVMTMRISPLLLLIILIIYDILFGFVVFEVAKKIGGKIAALGILLILTAIPLYPLFFYAFGWLLFRQH